MYSSPPPADSGPGKEDIKMENVAFSPADPLLTAAPQVDTHTRSICLHTYKVQQREYDEQSDFLILGGRISFICHTNSYVQHAVKV